MKEVTDNQSLTPTGVEKLKQLIAKIEKLEEEKANVGADIKEVYGEAKAFGFDTKIMRKVVALRKKDRQEREEEALVEELYLGAVEATD